MLFDRTGDGGRGSEPLLSQHTGYSGRHSGLYTFNWASRCDKQEFSSIISSVFGYFYFLERFTFFSREDINDFFKSK